MMTTENLIFLVYSRPEIWDQSNTNYSNKDLKLKAWNYIGEKMNLSVNQAKVRWTNLRDLFRRELKKTLKMAKMTGDPESYIPRWRHFRSLLFLKDQMVKDDEIELPCLTFDDSMAKHYPQTILEDDDDSKGEMEYFIEYPQTSASNGNTLPTPSYRKQSGNFSNGDRFSHDHSDRLSKKQRIEESSFMNEPEDYPSFVSNAYNETDEDYHFVMSILPSVRRIRQDRKTSFKMKILQLIVEEEKSMQA